MDTEVVLRAAEEALGKGDVAGGERHILNAWPDPMKAPTDAKHILGAIRGVQRRFQEAEQLLRSAVNDEPKSLRHHIALGHVYVSGGAHGAAADAYGEALRIDPAWPGLRMEFAVAAYRGGRYAEAEKAARQAAQESPNPDAWDTLSCALREQGKFADALKAADQALALRPEHAAARHSRAAAQLGLGKAQDALIAVDALISQGVVSAMVLHTRAGALQKLGRKQEAEATYAEAATRWPNDPLVRRRA